MNPVLEAVARKDYRPFFSPGGFGNEDVDDAAFDMLDNHFTDLVGLELSRRGVELTRWRGPNGESLFEHLERMSQEERNARMEEEHFTSLQSRAVMIEFGEDRYASCFREAAVATAEAAVKVNVLYSRFMHYMTKLRCERESENDPVVLGVIFCVGMRFEYLKTEEVVPAERVQEDERTCGVCLQPNTELRAVALTCGHAKKICRACLENWWGEKDASGECPLCRKR